MNKKGKLTNTIGNITEPQRTDENEIILIPHIANNIGKMGAGVALAIKNKWPKAYNIYIEELKIFDNYRNSLGSINYIEVEKNIYVFNMIAQNGIKNKDDLKPIKYCALIKCMKDTLTVIGMLKSNELMFDNKSSKYVIHCPKFGNLRAGGNFEFILELINEIWIENGIDVVIYEYKE